MPANIADQDLVNIQKGTYLDVKGVLSIFH